MSVSTDAILVYGFEMGEDGEDSEFAEKFYEEYDRNDGIEFVSHCSGEYPMWIIGISESRIRAWRGDPKMVDPAKLIYRPEWDKAIIHAADEYGIQVDMDRLGWWLASDWS